jgi:hypothetical protein
VTKYITYFALALVSPLSLLTYPVLICVCLLMHYTVSGVMFVYIHGAENLASGDHSECNPYCMVFSSGKKVGHYSVKHAQQYGTYIICSMHAVMCNVRVKLLSTILTETSFEWNFSEF